MIDTRHVHDVLVLGSGGPDSVAAYFETVRTVDASKKVIYGRVALPTWSNPAESAAVERLVAEDLIPASAVHWLPSLVGHTLEDEDAHFPARNLLLCTIAASAGYSDIILTVQQDEMEAADRTADFLLKAGEMLSSLTARHVTVRTPFADMDKTELVQQAQQLKGDFSWTKRVRRALEISWSCYRPHRTSHCLPYVASTSVVPWIHCGNCPACVRRFVAFKPNGLETYYAIPPWTGTAAKKYLERAKAGKLSEKRKDRILCILDPLMRESDVLDSLVRDV